MKINYLDIVSSFKNKLGRLTSFTKPHLVAIFIYSFATIWYMGPAVTDCRNTVYGFGDNTAGLIWRYEANSSSIYGGFSDRTNFPTGESSAAPTAISGTFQFGTYWTFAKLFGSKCGMNVMNIVGFMTSSLVMYGFMVWLTRNRYIAGISGFIVTFAPYFQTKVGGHPVYGYQAIFIGLIWLFASIIKRPTYKKAIALGALGSVGILSDPYFVLLIGVVWGSLLLGFVLSKMFIKGACIRSLWQTGKYLLVATLLIVATLAGLAGYWLYRADAIRGFVSQTRGNVIYEARACSNLPHEYLLPFAYHEYLSKLLGSRYTKGIEGAQSGISCGYGEDTVGLSPVIILSVLVAPTVVLWDYATRDHSKKIKKRGENANIPVVIGVVIIGIASTLLALPPYIVHGIPTPSYLLLDATTTWRTLTRLYVLVNISGTIIFAAFAHYVLDRVKPSKRTKIVIFLAIALSTLFLYQIFRPFNGNSMATFNYNRDANPAYYWLKSQASIDSVAEYPLEKYGSESDAMSYYLSMQVIHGKRLLNGVLPNGPQESIRAGLKDLADPQTIPTLRALGIQAVIVHGLALAEVEKLPDLEVLYSTDKAPLSLSSNTAMVIEDNMVIAKIRNGPKSANSLALVDGNPRNTLIIKSLLDWSYELLSGARLNVNKFSGDTNQLDNRCVSIRTALENSASQLIIKDDRGTLLAKYELSSAPISIKLPTTNGNTYIFETSNGHNMRIYSLGCSGS